MRNVTTNLTGDMLDRSNHYAAIVAGFIDGSGSSVVFTYAPRDGGEVVEREAVPVEIVGTPGLSTYGFRGDTPRGPRTFNFHLMGA